MPTTNRSFYYKKISIDGKEFELDFLYNKMSKFVNQFPQSYYTVVTDDIGRPDRISLKVYKDQNYWWIICYNNLIHDIWNDLKEGDVLNILDVRDVQEFMKQFVIKRNK